MLATLYLTPGGLGNEGVVQIEGLAVGGYDEDARKSV